MTQLVKQEKLTVKSRAFFKKTFAIHAPGRPFMPLYWSLVPVIFLQNPLPANIYGILAGIKVFFVVTLQISNICII